ncbi:MAG: HEPN domain-containing protein, partial [Patescibacteria group bacterium]|nr:HEPN domain-containing protein [Patescibacteria group bacterium]
WLTIAENNLKTANILTKSEELVSDSICFHCQQAVEKYLKAFLVFHQKDFRKTHIIAELLKLCIDIDDSFSALKDLNIQSLSIYAIEIRYPDDFYIPTIEEAKEAISLAEKTKEFVVDRLKEKGLEL